MIALALSSLPLIYWIACILGLAAIALLFWKLAKDAPEGCEAWGRFIRCRDCSPAARRNCPYKARE